MAFCLCLKRVHLPRPDRVSSWLIKGKNSGDVGNHNKIFKVKEHVDKRAFRWAWSHAAVCQGEAQELIEQTYETHPSPCTDGTTNGIKFGTTFWHVAIAMMNGGGGGARGKGFC